MHRYCARCNQLVEASEYVAHVRGHRQGMTARGSTRRWRQLRELVLQRDGHRCRVCGSEQRLEVHHVDGNSANDDPLNLQVRCTEHNPRGPDPL